MQPETISVQDRLPHDMYWRLQNVMLIHCSCSIGNLRLHVIFRLWVVFVSRQSTVLNSWFFAYIGALISMTTSHCVVSNREVRWPIRAKHNSIPVLKHNNLLKNTTIFWTTQKSFWEHNNLFENTTIFSRTQQSFREHNSLFQNTRNFPDAQQSFPKHNNIFWYTNAN